MQNTLEKLKPYNSKTFYSYLKYPIQNFEIKIMKKMSSPGTSQPKKSFFEFCIHNCSFVSFAISSRYGVLYYKLMTLFFRKEMKLIILGTILYLVIFLITSYFFSSLIAFLLSSFYHHQFFLSLISFVKKGLPASCTKPLTLYLNYR